MNTTPIQTLLQRFNEAFTANELVKLSLSKQRNKQSDLKTIIVTPVELKNGRMLNFVYRHNTRDITKNHPLQEALVVVEEALKNEFQQADMYLGSENCRVLISKKGEAKFLTSKVEVPVPVNLSHDRTRVRKVETHGNVWLRELRVTNEEGEVRHEMKDKYLQINRYIELLEPEIAKLTSAATLQVADMGSGKGYLTFALFDFLKNKMGKDVRMLGVEYRADLVKICNDIAGNAGFNHLRFIQGTIEETPLPDINILIALHACDTATDEAISRGIESGAELIVCAPCCQKQVRREMNVTNELSAVLKHGILMERQAELITDGLRALIMEAFGYKTKVFEFISSEHTAKNVMIVGRKTAFPDQPRSDLLEKVSSVKAFYGIKRHHLEKLLGI